ncbi:hypothetical protein BDZ85DRAFT_263755 [Elsinoe ampelina]|uniref:Uncharacterized protein n=1 Tax=Elsinoe ampelina TaxID=302913 RepID=A0A6A6G9X2_9PEZI|nr:hypothetical protein BDZ85DRAFT_263755 [Elsinoe ampelina]
MAKLKTEYLVTLQYRDRHSVGAERQRLGLSAFHWSVAVHIQTGDKHQYHRYDVTDAIILNDAGEDINPDRNWVYRHQTTNTLTEVVRYLGAVRIPSASSTHVWISEDLDSFFRRLPVPKVSKEQEENCLTWARSAIDALREGGRVDQSFDVDEMMAFALTHADERIKDFKDTPEIVDYPPKPEKQSILKSFLGRVKRTKA